MYRVSNAGERTPSVNLKNKLRSCWRAQLGRPESDISSELLFDPAVKLIGDCGFHLLEGEPRLLSVETLDPDYQGQGYATEAV